MNKGEAAITSFHRHGTGVEITGFDCRRRLSAGCSCAIPRACAIPKHFCALISTRRRSKVREPLVHRNDIPGEPRTSRRRNATAMVRPRHRANNASVVRIIFARCALGGRSQNRGQPSPEIGRVVSQTRTFLQRRHRRCSKALLERAAFINVPARPRWRGNSSRSLGKTHGSALLRGIKSAKSSLGRIG